MMMIIMVMAIMMILMTIMLQVLEQPLDGASLSRQVCTPGIENTTARDHTNFLLVIAGYMSAISVIFILGFSTTFKRSLANQREEQAGGGGEVQPTHM